MCRSASVARTSLDASSSAWPGATSAMRLIENCRFVALQRARPEAAFELRDVVDADRHRSATGTVSLPIGLDVAALALEHADLHRVLLAASR